MTNEAEKLNKRLESCCAGRLLSETGRRFYFPRGIVYQCGQASQHAGLYNVSVGMAFSEGQPLETCVMRNYLPKQLPAEAVAYAPTPGDKKLRELWQDEMLSKNPSLSGKLLSESIIVPGLTNGIAQCASLFADPGDTVLLPDLFWGNYRLVFETGHNASLRTYPFFTAEGSFNCEGLYHAAESSSSDKLIFIFNFPNNPSGYSLRKREAESCFSALKKLAESGRTILCICDDSYFGLFYEKDIYKQSMFASLADLHENILAVKVDGATKEHFFWGMRLGFMTFGSRSMTCEQYDALADKTTGLIRACVSSSNRLAQTLLREVITDPEYIRQKEQFGIDLQKRYNKVRDIVDEYKDNTSLTPLPFNSGYFMCMKTAGDAEKLREYLLFEKGIGAVSFGNDLLRIAYALVDSDKLDDLFEKIYEAADDLYGS
jgi:aspartate/methionine/tyrosine aminotransferase